MKALLSRHERLVYVVAILLAAEGCVRAGFDTGSPGETDAAAKTPCPADVVVNYRSIGSVSGTLYTAGTASAVPGSKTVTFGGGATLPRTIGRGDRLTINGQDLFILDSAAAARVTLQRPASLSASDAAYSITRAYVNLQAWETDREGDLVADNRREEALLYSDAPFISGFQGAYAATISGSNTDMCRYLSITAAPGHQHQGRAGAGVVIDGGASLSAGLLSIRDDYTRIEGLELVRSAQPNSTHRPPAVLVGARHVLLERLLIHDFAQATGSGVGIRASLAGAPGAVVRNCVIHDGNEGIRVDNASAEIIVQNSTIHGMLERGISLRDGVLRVSNSIVVGSAVDLQDVVEQEHCISTDASASGTGSITGIKSADLFESVSGVIDLHLKGGARAIDAGTTILDVAVDVDGQQRPRGSGWDIGADEH